MKKTLTILILTMFLLSLGTVFAAPENTGPRDGTGVNHDAVIAAGGQNGTGTQDGTGMNNDSGYVNREQTENKGTGNQNLISSGPKTNGNKTQGQCVAAQAKIKNTGFKEAQNRYKSCRVKAKNQTDSKAFLSNCRQTYKNETNQYKATYKLGKTECGNLVQKNSSI